MTPANLEELKRAAEAATGGDWTESMCVGLWEAGHSKAAADGLIDMRTALILKFDGQIERDGRYIARANPTAVLSLLAENDRLRSELEAERERRRGAEEALTGLMHAAKDAHIEDDLIASIWPDKRERNGQPTVDVVKNARRAMNAGRAHFQSQEASNGE